MKTRSSPFLKLCPLLAAGFFVVAPAQNASADLIYLGLVDLGGQGIGGVPTVLSVQPESGKDSTDNACGSITFSSGSDVIAECAGVPTNLNGGANNQTRTFAEIEADAASDIRLIFNINEPGNDLLVTLNELTAYFYNAAGTLYHTASYFGPPNLFTQAGNGVGGAGHAFALDAAQAAIVQSQFSLTNRIGAKVSLSMGNGGFETINVGAVDGDDVTPVPEPFTATLFGTGLLALAAVARRRRNARKTMVS